MRILLDTCTFLWLSMDDDKLSEAARSAFTNPANEVNLSVVSGWEIVVKSRIGKLPLPSPATRFVRDQRIAHGIEPLAIEEAALAPLEKLPMLHNDPFDRMLVAQAISLGLTLLTPDHAISQYPVLTHW